jgi:preprotein translocase subunit SecE
MTQEAVTEEGPNKPVHLMFLSGGLILFFLLNWTAEWLIGYFVRHPSDLMLNAIAALLALIIGVIAYRNDRIYTLAYEVASELRKVTWPTKKETQVSTVVVIIMVLVSTLILGGFDAVWSAVTSSIYG